MSTPETYPCDRTPETAAEFRDTVHDLIANCDLTTPEGVDLAKERVSDLINEVAEVQQTPDQLRPAIDAVGDAIAKRLAKDDIAAALRCAPAAFELIGAKPDELRPGEFAAPNAAWGHLTFKPVIQHDGPAFTVFGASVYIYRTENGLPAEPAQQPVRATMTPAQFAEFAIRLEHRPDPAPAVRTPADVVNEIRAGGTTCDNRLTEAELDALRAEYQELLAAERERAEAKRKRKLARLILRAKSRQFMNAHHSPTPAA